MPFNREHALDILGLPTFANDNDILRRYQALSLMWFPEVHVNRKFAEEEFLNISEATLSLVFPEKTLSHQYRMQTMYSFFQYVFFRNKSSEGDECHYCDSDDESEENSVLSNVRDEIVANDNACELLFEEEREKNKAEKRRLKKKKRKERRKLEKLAKEVVPEKVETKDSSTEISTQVQENNFSESEEDIDPNSAFVSVIIKKQKKHSDIEIRDDPCQAAARFPEEDPHAVVLRSRVIAARGNEMANSGHYAEAVELFSESIGMDPSDHRFYGNRSFCYDRLNQFERALKDAEKSIKLCPVWAKGYFRKGRALIGLKNYALAEECFKETLKYDNDCEDAVAELRYVKILQIMSKGYSQQHAEQAIAKYSTVQEALSSLAAEKISRIHAQDDIFISDDEETNWNCAAKTRAVAAYEYDVKRDPKNPEGHSSLWVGNVQPDVTEKKLVSMFSKFGELISVKLMPDKFCAFINYKSKASPGKAMQAYQGLDLSGAKLCVRFPNLPGETTVKKKVASVEGSAQTKGPVNGNECYYWRTTGCIYAEQCRYKHIKDHKGIDKKKWMVS